MRQRAIVVVGILVLAALTAGFFFLPVVQAAGPCAGGLACVPQYSLSCQLLGFGSYNIYSGRYFLTWDCGGFT